MPAMDLGRLVDSIEILFEVYTITNPPMPRHVWFGITEQQNKDLSEGIYPLSINPHGTARSILKSRFGITFPPPAPK